jgi:hypothetical protein
MAKNEKTSSKIASKAGEILIEIRGFLSFERTVAFASLMGIGYADISRCYFSFYCHSHGKTPYLGAYHFWTVILTSAR